MEPEVNSVPNMCNLAITWLKIFGIFAEKCQIKKREKFKFNSYSSQFVSGNLDREDDRKKFVL